MQPGELWVNIMFFFMFFFMCIYMHSSSSRTWIALMSPSHKILAAAACSLVSLLIALQVRLCSSA
jgi:hypothetical protein